MLILDMRNYNGLYAITDKNIWAKVLKKKFFLYSFNFIVLI